MKHVIAFIQDHIAWEIALEAADNIRAELTEHRTREERFFEKMAPIRTSP